VSEPHWTEAFRRGQIVDRKPGNVREAVGAMMAKRQGRAERAQWCSRGKPIFCSPRVKRDVKPALGAGVGRIAEAKAVIPVGIFVELVGTPAFCSAAYMSRLFWIGTVPSSCAWKRMVGGVLAVTCVSLEKYATSAGSDSGRAGCPCCP